MHDGNPTSYLGNTLVWEGKKLKQLTMPIQPGISLRPTVCSYEYDENGLRLEKTVNGTTTEYYYNGSVLIGMKIGTGSSAKMLRFSYDASGNVVAVDYSSNNGSSFATYYYLRNAQNDIVKIVDSSGNSVVEYIYDSWGKLLSSTGKLLSSTGSLTTTLGTDQPFRYRGYVYDAETQWYYLQSRYYDPNTCRFISADVLLSTGQGVIGHNSFAYCGNNPIAREDPSGLEWWHWAIAGALVVAAAAACVITCGGAAPAIAAVAMVASGTAAATASATVAAGVFIGASTALACSAMAAAADSNSVGDFMDHGNLGTVVGTVAGGVVGGCVAYGYWQSQNTSCTPQLDNGGLDDCLGPECFVAGTQIKSENGSTAIEEIKVGDYVFAADPESGESGYKRVLQTFVNETYETVDVTFEGETITTTPTHPFYVPNKGWTNAIDLRAGDILVTCNGKYVVVEKVQHEILENPIEVYNFEVEDYHTYYVSAISNTEFVLVHNRCSAGSNELSDSELSCYGEPGKNSGFRVVNGSHDDAMGFVQSQTKSLTEYAPGKYVGYNSRGIEFRIYDQVQKSYTSIRINGVKGLKGIKFLW